MMFTFKNYRERIKYYMNPCVFINVVAFEGSNFPCDYNLSKKATFLPLEMCKRIPVQIKTNICID